MTHSPRPPLRPRNIGIGDLRHYRFPAAAVVSILHRISGALMFLSLPLLLWLFALSLKSAADFDRFAQIAKGVPARLVLLALGWALLHHACAGVRFLLLDVHLGTEREVARRTAWGVFAVSGVLALLLALCLFGAN
jgi:succinate dehydrogenase / fumarate reductase cytochrome b subunit